MMMYQFDLLIYHMIYTSLQPAIISNICSATQQLNTLEMYTVFQKEDTKLKS